VSASAPAPEPAPEPNTDSAVTFDSKRIKMVGFTLSHVEATKHRLSTGSKEYTAMIVHLANYDRGGSDYLPRPSKDGRRRVTLNFASPGDLEAGSYPLDGVLGEGNKLSVGIHNRDHHIGLVGGGTGTGEITAIDDGTVSGKVDVKDEHGTAIQATFTVAYETKK
jgi:hypothetical protein